MKDLLTKPLKTMGLVILTVIMYGTIAFMLTMYAMSPIGDRMP